MTPFLYRLYELDYPLLLINCNLAICVCFLQQYQHLLHVHRQQPGDCVEFDGFERVHDRDHVMRELGLTEDRDSV